MVFKLGLALSLLVLTYLGGKMLRLPPSGSVLSFDTSPTPTLTPTPTPRFRLPGTGYTIPFRAHLIQSFNNCGPASLSMLLSYHGISVSQEMLGEKLRPYQHPTGDNDDKSVSIAELVDEVNTYGLVGIHRPNGSLELIKTLIANDVPVLVRTLLHTNDDIGHYRILRGYDDTTQEIIQDDSYQGKDLRFSYSEFLSLWQPYHYEYLVVVPTEQEALLQALIGSAWDTTSAWRGVQERAAYEATVTPDNVFAHFTHAISAYYLGDYRETVATYERIAAKLPRRMLWYQLEPLEAYLKLEQYDKVLSLTESILSSENRAYTELYILRGKVFEAQGNREQAQSEYEQALFYNKNSKEAAALLSAVKQ